MPKVTLYGFIRVIAVNLSVVGLSAWISVSLNRSFVKGRQETFFEYGRVNGNPVLRQLSAAEAKQAHSFQTIDLSELKKLRESGEAVLVDGRSQKDYEMGHIPGARYLGVADFERVFPSFAERFSLKTKLVIYCGGGDCSLSRKVAELLYSSGYNDLRIYSAGYSDWFLNGNPVEKGKGQ